VKLIPIEIKNEKDTQKLMTSLGVSKEGIGIMSAKSRHCSFKIEGIRSWEANIIKQHLLSLGSDAAIERDALVKNIKTNAFIFGNVSQLRKLCKKLENQPFGLGQISKELVFCLDNINKEEFVFLARDKVLKIKKPIICGIVNITEDSFSGDGLLKKCQPTSSKLKELVLRKAEVMIKNGAKIIDIGAESSRPFSRRINDAEEIKRIITALEIIRKKFKTTLISVDTYKYSVAKKAIDYGADIINDITALRSDERKATLIKKHKLGCILMHMKGSPSTMQINPRYKDVVKEQIDFFKERLKFCSQKGINKDSILIDPGIGFGKRLEDNSKIINELYKFKIFGLPIFLGLSRKSFIGKILNVDTGQRLVGTIAASIIAINKGANILRVHDVAQTAQAFKVAAQILNN
jgi:dihydropteroate synthase